jgi:hypothetical protein
MCLPASFAFRAGLAGRVGVAAAAPEAVLIIRQRTGAF